ncbi:S41 family peptidase [Tahibacter harae]|uniref:S41 family peptidase n=1 Tax=Tahibacter harae TaxID=2963937 RepID=A0ABT1QNF5_9GAMM|nr:S41 family peptidase [Tahibacter harae]MCQ4163580.1 S41 family peptidase [Tahibacter harae]
MRLFSSLLLRRCGSVLLCSVFLSGLLPPVQAEPPLTPAQVAEVVNAAAAQIRGNHFDTDEGRRIAAALQAWQAARPEQHFDAAGLSRVLTATLREISGDRHFRVLREADLAPSAAPAPGAPAAAAEEAGAAAASGILEARVDGDGVGRLVLAHFPADTAQSRQAYAAAMASLHSARALLIDLRGNRGGDPLSVAQLQGYLFARPAFVSMDFLARGQVVGENRIASDRPGWHLPEPAPMAVLISAQTFSGGEALAYDLKAYGRAVLLGETSGGAANPTRLLELPQGFALSVPYLSPRHRLTGGNWEGRGVTPDIACAAQQCLEQALALLCAKLGQAAP